MQTLNWDTAIAIAYLRKLTDRRHHARFAHRLRTERIWNVDVTTESSNCHGYQNIKATVMPSLYSFLHISANTLVNQMAMFADASHEYFAISNIPVPFSPADLRNYFNQFIESDGFQCFHYRHRPEVLRKPEVPGEVMGEEGCSISPKIDRLLAKGPVTRQSCCCVVSVHARRAEQFVRMYAGKSWVDSKGNCLASRCVIRRVKVPRDADDSSFLNETKYEQRHRVSLTKNLAEADFKSLPELNPPSGMQEGNVGTPVKGCQQLIQVCRLPPRLVQKLGLTFVRTNSNSSRHYGNVSFQYPSTGVKEDTVLTAAGHEIPRASILVAQPSGTRQLPNGKKATETDEPPAKEEQCKEWLYEEEIELKWEKGDSDLVFDTNGQYWQEEEEGEDGGDMDACDDVGMHYEERQQEGLEKVSEDNQFIGSFERFTKAFGRRMMEKQGWKDGEGLGQSKMGICQALDHGGQDPSCRTGFGYHEEERLFDPAEMARGDIHISVVYQEPKNTHGEDTLLRRQPNTSIKYRDWQPGGIV